MDCSEVLNLIDDYYDENVSDDQRIEIDKHLGLCFQCSTTFSEMNNYFQQLKSFSQQIEKPPALQKEITSELIEEEINPEEPTPKKKGFRLFRKS